MAAGVGSIASANAPDFYCELTQPDLAPPTWVFGPVWTTLWALMGIAAWLVWRERDFGGARVDLSLFLAKLAVWSWQFFAWQ